MEKYAGGVDFLTINTTDGYENSTAAQITAFYPPGPAVFPVDMLYF